ncbi:hypothetical protein [Paenibacillus sp. J2TS4]|uniref:hypothetical protein n=1 Tax=Paenibacillus sp. J2TS4 TaxID=2807194 RepID=UPI001AFE74A7|nr:hypothetical protein [Paenibacillus sp. J2TS4]GIP33239.1 hypothetical protein J2TS4_24490 [Paenibacillus sp. J2TS4]
MKVQDLKTRVEELTEQNQTVLDEIDQLKKLIREGLTKQPDNNSSGQQRNQQSSGQQGSSSSQHGGQQQRANAQVSDLANELMQIKTMITELEARTNEFVSNQSSGSLKEQDVVNLVLTLMDGMIDWTADFVQNNSQGGSRNSSASGGS